MTEPTPAGDVGREGSTAAVEEVARACERCGYRPGSRWPRVTVRVNGIVLSGGELPIAEMMERGWIGTIDPAEPGADAFVLAELRDFFSDAGVEIAVVPEATSTPHPPAHPNPAGTTEER